MIRVNSPVSNVTRLPDEGTEREVWQGDIDEGEMLQSSRSDTTHRKAPLTKKASTQSMLSTLSLDSGESTVSTRNLYYFI